MGVLVKQYCMWTIVVGPLLGDGGLQSTTKNVGGARLQYLYGEWEWQWWGLIYYFEGFRRKRSDANNKVSIFVEKTLLKNPFKTRSK